ncbi:wiskott-Aldrich syndrome protein homolog 1 isoform X2 [Mastacembelus armatus]|uniref:Uncharacterized LOC113125450 n=1 Tax=Mastacembelus armatus TaxID=205130 RepID=A0A3Q3MYW4_9TELE|nr:wiskott-Aldrich syndrome protein homolog 1-like isoform X2 [Mastacembelus armatus]
MSTSWRDDDEDLRVGEVKGALRSKPRFSFTEVKLLLEAVKKNRYIILRKFNQGVSAETKKQTWAEITNQINSLGENHREVRQIMKKWADLKCDGKRRIAALRGPNGTSLRKKNLGPVEKMVHKILMMSPRGDGDSDLDLGDDDFSKLYSKVPPSNPPPYAYLSLTDSSLSLPGGASLDISPLSSPEKELTECTMDFDENEESMFSSPPPILPPPSSTSLDPLPDEVMMRVKPVYTYSRNNSQNQNHTQSHTSSRVPTGPCSSMASTSSVFPSASDSGAASSSAAPPLPVSPTSSSMAASSLSAPFSSFVPPPASSSASDSTSHPVSTCFSIPPPPAPPAAVFSSSSFGASLTSAPSSAGVHKLPPSSSSVLQPQHPPSSNSSDPLPAGASFRRSQDHVAQVASQSLQQQRASRMLLTSVSQSLEILAQSVQVLVESQQEFVQESLLLQRETVDILRDFSNTALTMLRDKANSGHLAAHHHHHHHPPSHF